MRKRIADIIAETAVEAGITDVFMITGGGAMHLNDGFGRCKKLHKFFNHHEQACAMAAEAYCRFSGRLALLNVTTGPGGVNALNGVYGAYVDSIGMLVVSGQIKRSTMARNYPLPLRSMGDQEIDIISLAKPVTKYAMVLQDPMQVKIAVQKAIYIAKSGRPGPTWIDVPMDVQGAIVEEDDLPTWNPDNPGAIDALRGDPYISANTVCDFALADDCAIKQAIDEIFARLKIARRPVLYAGSGVRTSGCAEQFRELADNLGIPAVVGWHAVDTIQNSHSSYAGRPGIMGDRPGNFTVENADFILTLACRLCIREVSYDWQNFAPNAWTAQVDVDSAELSKPTLHTNLALHANLRDVMPLLLKKSRNWTKLDAHQQYLAWCKERVFRYPVFQERHAQLTRINPYHFLHSLFEAMSSDDVMVTANGSACVMGLQSAIIKDKTRVMTNSGDASMGYDLPAAIGAAVANNGKRVICLSGDGSIMMNLQELQTIAGNNLPILIFMMNNNGYLSIKITQSTYFSDNILGVSPETGVTFPDFGKIAKAFDIPYIKIFEKPHMEEQIHSILSGDGPIFCEVMVDPDQFFEPKLQSKKLPDGTMVSPQLDDMAPFLPPDELAQNRIADEPNN